MKTIEKKIWSEYFDVVANGEKNFDLRLADWDIDVGDTLILKEWDQKKKKYTGRQIQRKVTFLIKTKEAENWGMWPKEDIEKYGFQIIGFRPEGINAEDSFHLGIKALIRNKAGKVLLLKVNKAQLKGYSKEPYWDIPGGRIHKNSTIEETLKREVGEETGLTSITSFKKLDIVMSNNLRIPLKNGETVGLILAIYVCEVGNTENIKLSEEHTEYGWFEPSDAAELLKVKYPAEFTDKIAKL